MWKKIIIGIVVALVVGLTAAGVVYASNRETALAENLRTRDGYETNSQGYGYRNQSENCENNGECTGENCEANCENNGECTGENCEANCENNGECTGEKLNKNRNENINQNCEENCENDGECLENSGSSKQFRGQSSSNSSTGRGMMRNK